MMLYNKLEQGIIPPRLLTTSLVFSLLLLPFAVLYWLVPLFSDLTIGNDYIAFSIQQQMDVAYSFLHGSFPLYAPGFAGGQSAAGMTLGQAYHPISHIAPLIPGYWDGDANTINTQLRLISLGVCHILLFYTLRALGLNFVASLILSFITVYNLRMLDLFRYGASLENYTAFILLCSLIMLRFIFPSKWLISVAIAFSSCFLMVGGHPQMAYIGFFGAALVTIVVPFFVVALKPGTPLDSRICVNYWLSILLFVLAGLFLSAPYISGFYFDFMSSKPLRVLHGYEWAISNQDTWGGGLRNLYAPLRSDVHGAFGGSSLLMLLVALPVLFVFRQRIPVVVLISFFLFVIFFLVSIGDATPLHYLTWKYLPFADKFRVPGRYSLMIIFPLLFVLTWLFSLGQNHFIQISDRIKLSPLTIVSLFALLFFFLMNASFDSFLPEAGRHTPSFINRFSNIVHDNLFHLGVVSLLFCAIYGELMHRQGTKKNHLVGLLLITIIFGQVILALRYGTWVIDDKPMKTLSEMNHEKKYELKLLAVPGMGMIANAVNEQMEHSILDPKLARIYRHVLTVSDEEQMWHFLATKRSALDAVIVNSGSYKQTPSTSSMPDTVTLLKASYNQMIFKTFSVDDALLSTNIPYRKNWKVTVDGQPSPVYRANGNETATVIPAGTHRIIFSYESKETVIGAFVATIAFFLLLFYVVWKLNIKGRSRFVAMIFIIVVPLNLFYVWYNSLYHGKAINTSYDWSSNDFPSKQNIAYGKETTASSILSRSAPYNFYSGLAVDGDFKGKLFATLKSKRPSWEIDLGEAHAVGLIKLYGLQSISLPVTLYASTDQENYQPISRFESNPDILSIDLKGLEVRYLAIRSEKLTVLAFRELEVYKKPSPMAIESEQLLQP